jgi:hypothetical protein
LYRSINYQISTPITDGVKNLQATDTVQLILEEENCITRILHFFPFSSAEY